jgi:hypothetical protein
LKTARPVKRISAGEKKGFVMGQNVLEAFNLFMLCSQERLAPEGTFMTLIHCVLFAVLALGFLCAASRFKNVSSNR